MEFLPVDDDVVVVPVQLRLESRTQGETVTANAAHVVTVRARKVSRFCIFQTNEQAKRQRR